ncbi:MAG: DUF2520 domain-containing protein [Prevotella sp.]|nr:DUF2520 domain-containing protein [Prevotella sp.]
MQQIQFQKIILIGAGNLATNLGMALFKAGHTINQVYSRTKESAETLAEKLHAQPTTDIGKLASNADIYIVALKDNVIASLLPALTKGREDRLFVHTAGSMPADIFKPYVKQYGVLYPMQTFSKTRLVSFEHIPCFIEANTPHTLQTIQQLASSLSDKVIELPSEKRKLLHLAAVFACNFSNLCYHLADKVLATENIPFDVMLPLIDETAQKVHDMPPAMAQTGPAIRYDRNVIDKHIDMLANMASINPNTSSSTHQLASLADFYQIASNLIHQLSTT